MVLAVLRPADAKSATLQRDGVALGVRGSSLFLSYGQIQEVRIERFLLWHSAHLELGGSSHVVSGLVLAQARVLCHRLEGGRVIWWQEALAARQLDLRAISEQVSRLAAGEVYARASLFSRVKESALKLASEFPNQPPAQLPSSESYRQLQAIRIFLQRPMGYRADINSAFVGAELARSADFFDRVEASPLTPEQRRAVVVDEDHNLVVAAAGSGKTSVIVAKAGWLVSRGYRKPSNMLLLAYAKDAQTEMVERLERRLGEAVAYELSVRTFHGLGLSIIGEAEGRRPMLARVAEDDRALTDLLREIISSLLSNRGVSQAMLAWFRSHFDTYKSELDFKTAGEYWNYIRSREIRSLKGDKVKSFEECEIANFLFLNGIAYEYERPYEHDTATSQKRQYQPDFYLTESGIYIEHFALSASGDTPPFIDREQYNQSRQWKLALHEEHGTTLIETFSHEKANDLLIENLTEKLKDRGVTLSSIPGDQIFSILEEQGRISSFTRLVATFLQHFKGAQLTIGEVSARAAQFGERRRAEAFLRIFSEIYDRYQASLAAKRQIDFHDMINLATQLVEAGRYKSSYGYILVDEFQDISPGRARLLKALLGQSDTSQLFAVGDDWQSIYRFAGSDIAIMREFEQRFGTSARIDLTTTFRCSREIASTAAQFILKNRAQIHKEVSTVHEVEGPGLMICVPQARHVDLFSEALQSIEVEVSKANTPASVLVLGRYRHSEPKNYAELARRHPRLKMRYLTVHRSKGLEADYVIVVGMCSGRYGFPTEMTDDPLLDLVLAAPEGHANAEERRLFYVAMTRARRRVFLLADGGPPSFFIDELLKRGGTAPDKSAPCPICVEGKLQWRSGKNGPFYGCSNWPYCSHTQPACHHCSNGVPIRSGSALRCNSCNQTLEGCPRCNGWLVPRKGKTNTFLGCSTWPDCTFTKPIPKESA